MKRIILILILITFCLCGCRGKTSSELLAEGLKEQQKGNISGAIVIFRNALEKDPDRVDVRHELARAYLTTAKYELAEKEFQKVQRLNPSQPGIQLEQAKLYNLMGKPDQAISLAEKYLVAHPASADAMESLGISYAARNQPKEAEEFFVRALVQETDRPGTKIELASLYIKNGTSLKAAQLLNEVIKRDPAGTRAYYLLADLEINQGNKEKALEYYKKIIANDKNESEAFYKVALISLDRSDIATASKISEELIAKFPRKAEGYRVKGMVSFRQNNLPEAIVSLQSSLKIMPSLVGYYYLGLCLYNQGELENALSQFRLILDRSPQQPQARIMVSQILLRQHRFDDAISEINRLLQSDDRNAIAHYILGSAYMAKGMYEEGLKELDRVTELDPRMVDAHLKKGVFHLSQGNLDGVTSDLKTAVKAAPEQLNARLMLASFYMRRNNQEKALSTLKEGLTGRQGDAALYTGMARIMFSSKRSDQGVQLLQKALAVEPAAVDAGLMLASYFASRGEERKAIQQYNEVLSRDASNVTAILGLAALHESKGRQSEAEKHYLKAKETRKSAAYLALAKRLARNNDFRQALVMVEEGLGNAPRTLALLELKSELQLQMNQFNEALKTLDDIEVAAPALGIRLKVNAFQTMNKNDEALANARRAVALSPESSDGYILLASVHQRQNDKSQAIQALKTGIRIDGRNPQTYLMLAELYALSQDYPQAVKTCEEMLRKQPGNIMVQFAMGNYLEVSGKKKEAVKRYQKVLTLNENFAPALNNLAYLFADGYGSRVQAVKLAETAAALDRENPRVIDTLGYAQLKNGSAAEARKTLERASALAPDDPTINYHLALALHGVGEKGLAAAKLKKSLQAGSFADAKSARQLLAQLN